MREKTLTVVGSRPKKLSGYNSDGDIHRSNLVQWAELEVRYSLLQKVKEGFDTLICGMAAGGDQIGAAQWFFLKKDYPNLSTIAAVPYSTQPNVWGKGARDRYRLLLSWMDDIQTICPDPTSKYDSSNKLQKRNEWMMDRVSTVIALWDKTPGGTGNGLKYAGKLSHITNIEHIDTKTFSMDRFEYLQKEFGQ